MDCSITANPFKIWYMVTKKFSLQMKKQKQNKTNIGKCGQKLSLERLTTASPFKVLYIVTMRTVLSNIQKQVQKQILHVIVNYARKHKCPICILDKSSKIGDSKVSLKDLKYLNFIISDKGLCYDTIYIEHTRNCAMYEGNYCF